MKALLTIAFRCAVTLSLVAIVLFPGRAAADLKYSTELSEAYEDNVIGLTADNPNIGGDIRGGGQTIGGMHLKGGLNDVPGGGGAAASGKKGDFSTSFYADIGWDHDLAETTGLLLLVSAEHKAYRTFDEFDFTIGTINAGITHRFSEMFVGSVAAHVSSKDFKGSLRDSTAYGLTAGIKEQLSTDLWLKEAFDIEQNIAKSSAYDYTGKTAGIRAGYDISDDQSVSAGYSYLVRDFKNNVTTFKLTSHVVSLDWTLDINDAWTLLAEYDRELADSNIANTATSNNIYTVGLRYEY